MVSKDFLRQIILISQIKIGVFYVSKLLNSPKYYKFSMNLVNK